MCRGGGGGKRLGVAISSGVANGMAAIVLEVRESNSAAIELYSNTGFETVGVRKGYYERGAGREDIGLAVAIEVGGVDPADGFAEGDRVFLPDGRCGARKGRQTEEGEEEGKFHEAGAGG